VGYSKKIDPKSRVDFLKLQQQSDVIIIKMQIVDFNKWRWGPAGSLSNY